MMAPKRLVTGAVGKLRFASGRKSKISCVATANTNMAKITFSHSVCMLAASAVPIRVPNTMPKEILSTIIQSTLRF